MAINFTEKKMKMEMKMKLAQKRTTIMGSAINYCEENKYFVLLMGLAIIIGLDPTEALAFDLDKAVSGMINPVVKSINDHWGKALLAMGSVGAVVAQGDLKTRMVGLGTGVAGGGLLMAAIKLGAGIS